MRGGPRIAWPMPASTQEAERPRRSRAAPGLGAASLCGPLCRPRGGVCWACALLSSSLPPSDLRVDEGSCARMAVLKQKRLRSAEASAEHALLSALLVLR